MSLINSVNRSGPKTEPWGTPEEVASQPERPEREREREREREPNRHRKRERELYNVDHM